MFGRKKPEAGDREPVSAREGEENRPAEDGPHDRSTVADVPAYYTELGFGHIDLDSLVIGVPAGRDLNVSMDQAGNPEFHVVTQVSRVIPRAFAAPKTAGQWRTMVGEMREQLEQQGADASIVDGPWGRELVAELPGAVFRAIGVDGNRWTAEVRIMSTPELADQAAEEGREVFRHLLVNRGSGPMPAREQLPLAIPDEIQQALAQAQQQMAAQQQAQAYQQQMAAAQQQTAQQPTAQQQSAAQQSPQQQAAQQQATQQQPAPQQSPQQPDGAAPTRRDGSAMDRLRGDDDL